MSEVTLLATLAAEKLKFSLWREVSQIHGGGDKFIQAARDDTALHAVFRQKMTDQIVYLKKRMKAMILKLLG